MTPRSLIKETLNRINPSYKTKITVLIIQPHRANHYICSFNNAGKLFTIDYGTPFKETTGIHGPYCSLEEVKRFFEKHFPVEPHGHSLWHPTPRPSGATSRPNAGAFIHGQSPWPSAAGVKGHIEAISYLP